MIGTLILLGLFGTDAAPGTGEIIAPASRTVTPAQVPATAAANASAEVPVGALAWAAPLDPADRAPYAIDWRQLLATDERVADIVRLTMSAAGAAVGVTIDQEDGRTPIIGTDGKAIQIWLKVADAFQDNAAFQGAGVRVAIAALIETDSVPFKRFERTSVLTVRQQ